MHTVFRDSAVVADCLECQAGTVLSDDLRTASAVENICCQTKPKIIVISIIIIVIVIIIVTLTIIVIFITIVVIIIIIITIVIIAC